jgi:hypothetical protein
LARLCLIYPALSRSILLPSMLLRNNGFCEDVSVGSIPKYPTSLSKLLTGCLHFTRAVVM